VGGVLNSLTLERSFVSLEMAGEVGKINLTKHFDFPKKHHGNSNLSFEQRLLNALCGQGGR
jgi:hypothetical protein